MAASFQGVLHALTPVSRPLTGPWSDCTIAYQREIEDGSGAFWSVDYRSRIDDDCVQVEVTKLEFCTDGPSFTVPLNAVCSRWLMALEAEIADELECER